MYLNARAILTPGPGTHRTMSGWVSQTVWTGAEKRNFFLSSPSFDFRIVRHVASLCSRTDEPMTRVPKMPHSKFSLARDVQYCPSFLNLFWPTSVSVLWWISDCVQTVYELQLLPNNTAVKYFLQKSGAVRRVDGVIVTWMPAWRWLGECVTLDRKFHNLLFKQEAVAAPVTATFSSLSHSSTRPLLLLLLLILLLLL